MKKRFLIVLIVALLAIGQLFSGCSNFSFENLFGEAEKTEKVEAKRHLAKKQYSVTKSKDSNQDEYKLEVYYKLDNYYVFQYYLGRVSLVPLETENLAEVYTYSGIGNQEWTLSTSYTTVETIANTAEEMMAETVENTVSITTSASITVGASTTSSAEIGTKKLKYKNEVTASVEANIAASKNKSTSTSEMQSVTNSYEKSSSNEITQQKTYKFTWDSSCPAGHYKFSHMGTFDVFATVFIDINTNEYFIKHFSNLAFTSYYLEYSEDDYFNSNSTDSLRFDETKLANMVIPSDIKEYKSENADNENNNGNIEEEKPSEEPLLLTAESTYNCDFLVTTSKMQIYYFNTGNLDLERLSAEGYKLKVIITVKLQGKENCKAYFTFNNSSSELARSKSVYVDEDEWEEITLTVDRVPYNPNNTETYPYKVLIFAQHNATIDFESECRWRQVYLKLEFYK